MIEQALTGHRNYWIWSLALLAMVAGAFYASALQSADGFVHTGMGNNAIWGLYHAQLPFLASIAAASLAVLVPRNASEIFIPCPPCPSGSFSRRNRFGYEPAFHCRRSWHATPFFDAAPEPLARRSGLPGRCRCCFFSLPSPLLLAGRRLGQCRKG